MKKKLRAIVRETRSRAAAAWWVARGHALAYRLHIDAHDGVKLGKRPTKITECVITASTNGVTITPNFRGTVAPGMRGMDWSRWIRNKDGS